MLLLFLAEGLSPAWIGWLSRRCARWLQQLLGALLWWLGPMPSYLYYPNQFMGHLRFQYDYDPARNPYVQLVPKEPVSAFYRQLAQQPPASLTLIEAPWRLESHNNPLPFYQEVHRQRVKIGLVTPVCGVRSYGEYPATVRDLRLQQFTHLSSILDGKSYGADYLIVHLAPWKTPPDAKADDWPDMVACLPAIEAKLGPPVYRDAQIVVFALKARTDSRSPAVQRDGSSRARIRNAAAPSDSRAPSPVWARR